MPKAKDAPTKSELEALRNKGLTRREIADKYNVSISTVKRWISKRDVQRKYKQPNKGPKEKVDSKRIANHTDGLTELEKAKLYFGTRLTEKKKIGYFLDGQPVSVFTILNEFEKSR